MSETTNNMFVLYTITNKTCRYVVISDCNRLSQKLEMAEFHLHLNLSACYSADRILELIDLLEKAVENKNWTAGLIAEEIKSRISKHK